MPSFFDRTKGGTTIYFGAADAYDVRFLILHHGEDVELAIKQFWSEHRGDFAIVPLTSYGHPPRKELCTRQSLTLALKTAKIQDDGSVAKGWREACEAVGVAWNARKGAPGWKAVGVSHDVAERVEP